MFVMSFLILSISIGTIVLLIHDRDEIHQIVAFLSSLVAILCAFILTPPLIKGLLGLLFVTMGHKIIPIFPFFKH